MSVALRVESVSKWFKTDRSRPSTLKERFIRCLTRRRGADGVFWALRDVIFSAEKGRVLGIIGHNGAGKSTLLRLLCGVGRPSAGSIHTVGKVSGLLELGSGFHLDMTGAENLMTAGILNGLTRRQVLGLQEEIVSFAELEEFIHLPLRAFSTGMYLRLSFSAAIHFDPDILMIDEVLAVGDSHFQQKCLDRLNGLRKMGKTLVLVSHSTEQIRSLCDEVLVLEEGRVVTQTDPEGAIRCYHDLIRRRSERRAERVCRKAAPPDWAVERGTRLGTREAIIHTVELVDESGRNTDTVQTGGGVTVVLGYRLARPLPDLVLLLGIYSETGVKCFETVIPSTMQRFGFLGEEGRLRCDLPALPLLPGRYHIVVGLYPPDWSVIYDYHWQMHVLHVEDPLVASSTISGIVPVHPAWYSMTRVERGGPDAQRISG